MSEAAADIASASAAALHQRQCASEPIHPLGAVQPNGFMLVVGLRSGLIVQVSAGVTRHWPGIAAAHALLGLSLRDLAAPAATGATPLLRSFECMGHAMGAHDIRDACARWRISFDWLELKLTETVVMANTEQCIEVLQAVVSRPAPAEAVAQAVVAIESAEWT